MIIIKSGLTSKAFFCKHIECISIRDNGSYQALSIATVSGVSISIHDPRYENGDVVDFVDLTHDIENNTKVIITEGVA